MKHTHTHTLTHAQIALNVCISFRKLLHATERQKILLFALHLLNVGSQRCTQPARLFSSTTPYEFTDFVDFLCRLVTYTQTKMQDKDTATKTTRRNKFRKQERKKKYREN